MAASPFSEPHNPNVSADQPWSDSKFSLYDSDIEFKSSDGFVFQLHRSVLGVATGGFPGTESDVPTNGEIVPLTETAEVLSILFAFLYPKPSPDLHGMGFECLLALAEAAAKYDVVKAVDLCNERLPEFLPKEAPAILDHAIKHDYRRLLAQTLPHFTPKPVSEILERLQPQYMAPYARYQDAWRSVFKDLTQVALTYGVDTSTSSSSCSLVNKAFCPRCRGTVFLTLAYLENIDSVETLREVLLNPDKDPNFPKYLQCCYHSNATRCSFFSDVTKTCLQKIDGLPSFATLLGLKV